MIIELLTIMAPVVICTGLGFLWARFRMPFDNATAGMVVYAFGSPALIFNQLATAEFDLALIGEIMLVSGVGVVVTAVAAWPLLRAARLDLHAFLPAVMHPNTGNLGLPLALFAFGDRGLTLAAAFYVVNAMSMYVAGATISQGAFNARGILRIPLIYAVIAALAVSVAGIALPKWIDDTTGLLGGLTIPLMLILLGNSLAGLRISSLGRCTLAAIIRLALGFAVGIAIVEALGWENPERGVVILSSTMPIAIFNIVLAERYRRSPEDVAGSIVVSTLMFFLLLPGLLWFVLD